MTGNRLELAAFLPNCGSESMSSLPMSTTWEWDYNRRVGVLADRLGFEYAITINHWAEELGRDERVVKGYSLEPLPYAAALLACTQRLRVVSTVYTEGISPYVAAKMGATCDQIGQGRWGVNVITGSKQRQYEMAGLPWRDHETRHLLSREFIEVLLGLWSQERFTYQGRHFQLRDAWLAPKPLARPHPPIIFSGRSPAAQETMARYADLAFTSGLPETMAATIAGVRQRAAVHGRDVKAIANVWPVCAPTEAAARRRLQRLLDAADPVCLQRRIDERSLGSSHRGDYGKDQAALWILGGGRPLVGTPEQVAAQIAQLVDLGMDCMACFFTDYLEDLEQFGAEVVPLLEQAGLRQPAPPGVPASR